MIERRDFLKGTLLVGLGLLGPPCRGASTVAIDLRRTGPAYSPEEVKRIHDYLMAAEPREAQQLLCIISQVPWSGDGMRPPQHQLMFDLGQSEELYNKILAVNNLKEAQRMAASVGLPKPRAAYQITRAERDRMVNNAQRHRGRCQIVT